MEIKGGTSSCGPVAWRRSREGGGGMGADRQSSSLRVWSGAVTERDERDGWWGGEGRACGVEAARERGRRACGLGWGRRRGSSDGGEAAAAPLLWIAWVGGDAEGARGRRGQIHGVTRGRQIHVRPEKVGTSFCLHFILFSSRDKT
jgi:hypothetical protein